MRHFTIGEVCRVLEVKPHIVRYWEQEIGVLSPSKDLGGRRIYTLADLQLLFRIKYLVQERKFTVEGAAQRLIEEVDGESADAKAQVHAVRAELLRLLDKIHRESADTLK
ncbi:MAG: MerR family transcriptional regulator [Spirochaetales bacterium]|nr:MerR family transcriptional regulator [Spirochaetales bacterium]